MSLFEKRLDYSPKVRKILEKVGGDIIASIEIGRTPVPSLLTNALNIISFGEFQKKFGAMPYDKLWHLFMIIRTTKGERVMFEKNEVINSVLRYKIPPNTELKKVDGIHQNVSINDFLLKGLQRQGKSKFFTYSASHNNCQDWIVNLLQANYIGGDIISFVKQDTKVLFEGLPHLRKIANTVTDAAAIGDRVLQGRGKLLSNNKYIDMPKKCKQPESDSDSDSDDGRSVHHHHHHYHMEGGAINFKKIGNTIKSGFNKTFTPKLGRQIASAAIHQGIPVVAGLMGDVVAGPLGGVAAGYAGAEAAKAIGKSTGYGIKPKRQARFAKGSAQAKEWGEKMRAMRSKK
jgi:hypothetical protein